MGVRNLTQRRKGAEAQKGREKDVPAVLHPMERYKERWDSKELAELARQLREFADGLEKEQRGSRRKAEK